ncbi:MAG: NACHT domain-containing protein [Nostoc sp. ChiQUE02]|nr:NACHT domain-containing protein [Nostoc sp. ChiQUE02]MDZ8229241.1 NACHT domain-containing protein [Nostoc sp. ChiQUE02]
MLNNPLITLLLTGLLAAVAGYLINQWPAIRDFPGRNTLIFKLTIEVVVLTGIIGGWKDVGDKSDVLRVLFLTIGSVALMFLAWHTLQLFVMLWQTRGESGGTVNGTTGLKTPDHWRRELLKAMKIYVVARLRDSLHNEEIIRLQMENRQDMVGRSAQSLTIKSNPSSPWMWVRQQLRLIIFSKSDTELEQGKRIIEIFEQTDIAGRLLILGDPGSGKTRMLLELARDLIERAVQQPDCPIPVLFELSSWKDDKQALGGWLISDLKFRYNVPEAISRHWLDTDKLLPLLDGLDELGLPRQKKCIERINDFLQNNSSLLPLVVCCRQEEYIKGEAILGQLRGAVYLQPLTPIHIQNYLRRVGYSHLWQPIKDDPEDLGVLAKIPLFLHLIPVAYPEGLVKKGKHFNSADERQAYQKQCRKELFDAYIKHRLEESHDSKGYKHEDIKTWLKWLAKTLNKQKQKEFFIEKIQPDYLDSFSQEIWYFILVQIIISLICGLMVLLIDGRIYGLFVGAMFGLLFAPIFSSVENDIAPIETLSWSWGNTRFGIFLGSIVWLTTWLFIGLIYGLLIGLFVGLFVGLLVGLIFGLVFGLIGDELKIIDYPNKAIYSSAKHAIFFMVLLLPFGMLIYAMRSLLLGLKIESFEALLYGIFIAIIFGIFFGGIACIQHFAMRLILWHNRSIPWNYAHFLSYAAERRLIQQVGGRYQFIHDLLQEHFASM